MLRQCFTLAVIGCALAAPQHQYQAQQAEIPPHLLRQYIGVQQLQQQQPAATQLLTRPVAAHAPSRLPYAVQADEQQYQQYQPQPQPQYQPQPQPQYRPQPQPQPQYRPQPQPQYQPQYKQQQQAERDPQEDYDQYQQYQPQPQPQYQPQPQPQYRPQPQPQPQPQYRPQPQPQYQPQYKQQQQAERDPQEDYDPNPSYQFGFDVNDDQYTNYQNRKEQREGNVIKGSYSVVDSDGFIRTVTYTADPKEGFKAEVSRQPTDIVVKIPTPKPQALQPQPVAHQPQHRPSPQQAPQYYRYEQQ